MMPYSVSFFALQRGAAAAGGRGVPGGGRKKSSAGAAGASAADGGNTASASDGTGAPEGDWETAAAERAAAAARAAERKRQKEEEEAAAAAAAGAELDPGLPLEKRNANLASLLKQLKRSPPPSKAAAAAADAAAERALGATRMASAATLAQMEDVRSAVDAITGPVDAAAGLMALGGEDEAAPREELPSDDVEEIEEVAAALRSVTDEEALAILDNLPWCATCVICLQHWGGGAGSFLHSRIVCPAVRHRQKVTTVLYFSSSSVIVAGSSSFARFAPCHTGGRIDSPAAGTCTLHTVRLYPTDASLSSCAHRRMLATSGMISNAASALGCSESSSASDRVRHFVNSSLCSQPFASVEAAWRVTLGMMCCDGLCRLLETGRHHREALPQGCSWAGPVQARGSLCRAAYDVS